MIWDKQSFVFLDSAVAQQGVPPAVPGSATEPYPCSRSRGEQGQGAVAFLPFPGSCHSKENKNTVLVEPALPECIYPCLIFGVSLTFLFKLLFYGFGLARSRHAVLVPLVKVGTATKWYSRGQQNVKEELQLLRVEFSSCEVCMRL